jgi:polyhydroxyalkanoate synthase subunit PhaC
MNANAVWMSSRAALPFSKSGLLPSRPEPGEAEEQVRKSLAAAALEPVAKALDRELRGRADAFLAGIERYRNHPYARDLDEKPVLWQEGTTRLRDYGGAGPALLVVPSLINRFYILDLTREASLLRFLASAGVRPLLVDWGAPGESERKFTLTDYVAGRLEVAADAAEEIAGGPLAVMGYCMGGLLALALAARRPSQVRALALLATPWSFHAERAGHAKLLGALAPAIALACAGAGEVPVDLLQTLFTAADPLVAMRKFSRFATLADGKRAQEFVAVEDWLNDGVPLALPVARECLAEWYGEDTPGCGLWRIAGRPVRPQRLQQPALVVVPGQDRIVPPKSAEALAEALPAAERLAPALGHIGMIVGSAAPLLVWQPLAHWLKERLAGGSQTRRGGLSKGRGTRRTRALP